MQVEQIWLLGFAADKTQKDTLSSFYLYYITFNSTYPVFLSLIFFSNYVEVQKYANKQTKDQNLRFLFDFTQFVNTSIIMTFLNIWRFTHSMHASFTSGDPASSTDSPSPLTRCFSPIWEWLVGRFDKQKTFLEVKGR